MPDSEAEPTAEATLRDARPTCYKCGEYIDEWAVFVRQGDWTGSTFENSPLERYWCRECYGHHREREAAVHYEIVDTGRLREILTAADGELVVDTAPQPFSSRLFVRIVDGELQALKIVTKPKEDRVIAFEPEPVEFTDDHFQHVFQVAGEDDSPNRVYVKSSEETPFADFEWVADDQSTFEAEVDGDE